MKKIFIFLSLLMVAMFAIIIIYLLPTLNKPVPKVPYIHNKGQTQGTYYTATYLQPTGIDLQKKIEARLHAFDLSLSTYASGSIISRINRNDQTVKTDPDFETVFAVAREVSEQSDGAFDITVGPLVKAWGFAFGNSDHKNKPEVNDFLPLVGYKKVKIVDHKVIKENPGILIDANAIAQGYSSDIIAKLLADNGCKNYMIEIGGEIVCKGVNPKGEKWRIGIDKPVDDSTNVNSELQTILAVSDLALTTSGNYRKFYYLGGKKYAHTIDPKTGFPVTHNLLSATVIAPTCIVADAYATAFMVLGVEKSMQLCKRIPTLECYLIYVDEKGENQVIYTDGFKKYISN